MNILIADDHELIGGLLKTALEQDPAIRVNSVRNFDDAYKAVGIKRADGTLGYDLVILDMRMPGMNGLSGLRRMRERVGTVPVAIMSGQLTPAEARQVMHEGAIGFVPKTLAIDELKDAILKMARGERFVPDFLMVSEKNEAVAARQAPPPGLEGLTPREVEVLKELVQGWSNKQIAQNLEVTEITVKAHLGRLFRKIGAKNRADAVRLALGKLNAEGTGAV
jgi:DNA-binding NarL/FixJ family response regulator